MAGEIADDLYDQMMDDLFTDRDEHDMYDEHYRSQGHSTQRTARPAGPTPAQVVDMFPDLSDDFSDLA